MKVQKKMRKQNVEYVCELISEDQQDNCCRIRVRKQRVSNPSIFIAKTFDILENDQYRSIIRWNHDGTNFIIEDVEKFEQQILAANFRHRNFSSFVRQLNMYDFHKIRNEANRNIFEHKDFKKHSKNLLKRIKRKGYHSKKNIAQNFVRDKSEHSDPQMIKSNKTFSNSKAEVEHSQSQNAIQILSPLPPVNRIESPKRNKALKGSDNSKIISSHPYNHSNLMEELISNLPTKVESEEEIEQLIKEMRNDSKYSSCLKSKQNLRRVIKKLKEQKLSSTENELEDLSIQQQIMVEKIGGFYFRNPSLAILSTEKHLPLRSLSLISSLHFVDEIENLMLPF